MTPITQEQIQPAPPISGPIDISEQVNVDANPASHEEAVSVDVNSFEQAPVSSPETMENRSFKFKYGLDEILQKSKEDIFKDLQNGNENNLREIAASTLDERKMLATQKAFTDLQARKGSLLTVDETLGLSKIMQNLTQKTDPKSVLEEAYGKQFMATLDRTAMQNPDSFLNDAKQQYPEEVAEIFNTRSEVVTKRTYAETAAQNARDEAKSQGWIPWIADQSKFFVPGYEDIKLRGNVQGVGVFSGVGLGQNLEEQRKKLLQRPFEDFKLEFDTIMTSLKASNPTIAVEFAESVVGMSTDDVMLKSSVLPTSVIGLGLGKATVNLGKATIRGVENVSGKQILKDTGKAADDMAKASAAPDVSKSTLEAAAGNVEEAAITQATVNTVGDMTNQPQATKRAVESLVGTFRTDNVDIAAGPGRFAANGIVNRIDESSNTTTRNLFKTITEMIKVDRLPDVMATEAGVRAVVESIKDRYIGLRNAVIDTSRPYRENIANTWLVDMHLGKADGTYFENRSVAENYMKFHGLAGDGVTEGKNVAFTKDAQRAKQLNKNISDAETTVAKIEARQKENKYATTVKAAKDQETLAFLRDEAIPNFKAELTPLSINQVSTVEQQGLGFYIKVTKPVDETSPIIRQLIAETTNTKIPDSALNRFLNGLKNVGKVRTPEDVLSLAERQARLATTYAPSKFFEVLIENSPTLRNIHTSAPARFSKKRQKWDEFVQVLENAQNLPDSVDSTKKGYFFKHPEEMETYYQQWVHRLPDENEIVAYFEFKRGMEIDRVFRNIAEHRNQQRVGAETHKVFSVNDKGERVASADFSGVIRSKLPGAQDNVFVINAKNGEEQAFDLTRMSIKEKADWQAAIDSGEYKLIEVYNPELRPLAGYGNIEKARVRFVLAKDIETRELDWNHIPRRGGGHLEYDYDFYLKQAKVTFDKVSGRHWYEGDTTLMPIQIQKMGADAAKHLNEVRKYLKGKNETEARDYSNKNLHIEWNTVKDWFTPTKDAAGNYVGAQLSLDQPILLLKRGEKIIAKDKELERGIEAKFGKGKFKDGTKEGSLARQSQVEYSMERDSFEMLTLEDKGTRGNPLYNLAPAKVVDPITTMNRGLSKIAKSNFMDDYKTMSIEHWLKQASTYLDLKDGEIRHSPVYAFKEGKWKSSADKNVTAQLDAAKFHIEQLVGQPSDLDAQLHNYGQKLADYMYDKAGPKSATIVQEWLLPTIKDPFTFMRSIAFNAKLGLFNVPQFIVQAGNYSNILGIAGYRYAAPGTMGAQLHFWSKANSNPAIIKHLDTFASNMNLPGTSKWKPGEFEEGFNLLQRTGFGNPAGEYAALDNPMSQKIISDAGRTFLDWGQFFFKQGERNSRYGAWYTAFKEFRDKVPTGRVTDEQLASILQRADLLNINMSRASSSKLHTGVLGIPTQFLTYQLRLTELVIGNRLTPKEKFGMFATNSLLYGIPMGAGLSGIPFSDYIRKRAMEGVYGEPYVVGDNFFSSLAMEGLVSSIGAVATGSGDPQAGTYFDIANRFGTKGFPFLGALDSSDKSALDVFGGPIYSIIKGTIEQSDGFMRAMISMARRDGDVFPTVAEDLTDVFKEISSVNTIFGTIAAINYGRAISKKEAYIADTSSAHAVFKAVTGLKDQRINDIQTMNNSMKERKNYEQEVEARFRQEFRRGVLAQKDNNPELSKKFFTRAVAWLEIGGYSEDRYNSLVSKSINDNESILNKVNFDFYIKKAPDALRKDRMKAGVKSMLIQDNQNGQ